MNIKNVNGRSIENTWKESIDSVRSYGGYNSNVDAALWESMVSFAPLSSWRPDNNINGSFGTLASHWMAAHCQANNPQTWEPFLNRVALDFPDLDSEVAFTSMCYGLGKKYLQGSRYGGAGSESLLMMWLGHYHEKMDTQQKECLLARAVNLNFFKLSQKLIDLGIAPSIGLPFVSSREGYDFLLKAGASTFEKIARDPYDKSIFIQDRDERIEIGGDVYENIIKRSEKSFISSADRDSIINNMSSVRLRKTKSGGSALSDEERSKILFTTIETAKKDKEVLGAIKKCLPDCLDWKIETEKYGKVNPLIYLCLKNATFFSVIPALTEEKKMPESWVTTTTENGISFFEIVMTHISNDMLHLSAGKNFLEKLKSGTQVDVEMLVRTMVNRIEDKQNIACPVTNSTGLTNKEKSLDDAYDDYNVWNIKKSDFFNQIKKHSESVGGFGWIEKAYPLLLNGISYNSYYSKQWKLILDTLPIKEIIEVGGKELCQFSVLDAFATYKSSTDSYYVKEEDKLKAKALLKKELSKFTDEGVSIESSLAVLKGVLKSDNILDEFLAFSQNELLKSQAKKHMQILSGNDAPKEQKQRRLL